MELMDRNSLKNLFKKGTTIKEANFIALIDSSLNIVDDGLSKNANDGLKLSPLGNSRTLLSFFNNIKDKEPAWVISLAGGENGGLQIRTKGEEGNSEFKGITLMPNGNVGIGTELPRNTLEVNGTIASKSIIGAYPTKGNVNEVPGNRVWQDVTEELTGNHAFEVMAYIEGSSPKKGKKYKRALLHAIAVCTYGSSQWHSIRRTQAYSKYFWDKIQVRWKVKDKENQKYVLQLRTLLNYGKDVNDQNWMIRFRIKSLWDDQWNF